MVRTLDVQIRVTANIIAAIIISLVTSTTEPSESEQCESMQVHQMVRDLGLFVSSLAGDASPTKCD